MKHLFFALITIIFLAIFFISYAVWFLIYLAWAFKPYKFKRYATIKGDYIFSEVHNYKDFFKDLLYLNRNY